MANENIKVVIKARPLIKRERDQKLQIIWCIKGDTIECTSPLYSNKYVFDQICDETSSNQDLYDTMAQPIVQSSVNGFNGTIFAYGQTSSGKTHTMLGNVSEPGVMVLAVRQIFSDIAALPERTFLVKVTYIEIYNEKVYDLLSKRNELKLQESGPGELNIGCAERVVTSEKEIMDLVHEGNHLRKVAETNMNVQSSRSHTIFSINIESEAHGGSSDGDGAVQASTLNLVDLAGSERADATTGKAENRFREGAHINKSLLSLNMVISKLVENQEQHINYRDSKLTRILQPSLGGNSMTAIICTITLAAIDETIFTLGFATRAKQVKNKPVVNEVISDSVALKRMTKQISTLEEQLTEKENKLRTLKGGLFNYQRAETLPKLKNRRRTWAFSLKSFEDVNSVQSTASDHKNGFASPIPKSIFGQAVEYTDEEFELFMNASILSDNRTDGQLRLYPPTPSLHLARPKLLRSKPSLLKTPKSVRRMLNNEQPPTTSAALASPMGIDKDSRIKAIEEELEELRHFHQSENLVHNEVSKEFDELKAAHEMLLADMEKVETENKTLMGRFKMMEREMRETGEQREIAVQQSVSVEFEFEEFKRRFQRREKELIDQIEEFNANHQTISLKEKIKLLTDKGTALETQLWQNDTKFKAEIHELEEKLAKAIEHCKNNTDLEKQYANLQREYDEISEQLMDYIQDVDRLKNVTMQPNKEELEQKISDLQNQLELESSSKAEFEQKIIDLQSELEEQSNKTKFEQATKAELEREINDMRCKLDLEKSGKMEFEQKLIDLQSQLETEHSIKAESEKSKNFEFEQKITALKEQLDSERSGIVEFEQKMLNLQSQLEEQSKKTVLEQANKAELERKINDMQCQLELEQSGKSEIGQKLHDLQSQLEMEQANEAEIERKINDMQCQLELEKSGKSEIEQKLHDLQSQLELEQANKAEFERKINDMQCQLELEKADKSEIEQKLHDLQSQLELEQANKAELERKINDMQCQLELEKSGKSEIEQKLHDLQSQLDMKQANKTELERKISDMQCQLELEKSDKSEIEQKLHDLQGQLELEHLNKAESEKSNNFESEQKITVLQEQLDSERSSIVEFEQKMLNLQSQLEEQSNKTELEQANKAELERKINDMQCKLDLEKSGKSEIEQKLHDLQSQLEVEHSNKAESDKSNNLEFEQEITALQEQLDSERTSIVEFKQEMRNLRGELEVQSNRAELEQGNNAELQININNLQSELDLERSKRIQSEQRCANYFAQLEAEMYFKEKSHNELDDLYSKLSTEKSNYAKLKEELAALSQKNKHLENQLIFQEDTNGSETIKMLEECQLELINSKDLLKEKEELLKDGLETATLLGKQILEMNSKLADAETQNDSYQLEVDDFRDQIAKVDKELDTLKELHAQSIECIEREQAKNKELEENNQTLSKKLIEYQTELDELDKYCASLQHKNTMLDNASNQFRLAMQMISKEMEVLRASYTELQMCVAQQELDHLKFQKSVCESDETGNFSSMFNATSEASRLANETNDQAANEMTEEQNSSVTESLHKQINELTEKLELIQNVEESESVVLQRTIRDQIREITRLTEQCGDLDEMKTNLDGMKSQLSSLGESNAQLRNENDALKGETQMLHGLQNEVKLERSNRAELEQKILELQVQLEEQSKKVILEQSNKVELERKINDMQNKVDLEKSSKAEFEQKIIGLQSQLELDHSNTVELEQKILDLQNQLEEQSKKINLEQSNNAELQREIKDMQNKVDLEKSSKAELEQKIIGLQSQLELDHSNTVELEQKILDLQNQLEEQSKKVILEQSNKAELEREINDMQNKVDLEKSSKAEFEQKIIGLQSQLDLDHSNTAELVQKILDLQNQLEEQSKMKTKLDYLKSQLSSLGESNVQLKNENDGLKEETQTLRGKIDRRSYDSAPGSGSSSPSSVRRSIEKRGKIDVDSLLRENTHLKSVQKTLEVEVGELRRNTQSSRKMKRQSTHDDTRRFSSFDTGVDMAAQTDPVSEMCRCQDLAATIEKLRRDILIKDSQYTTLKIYSGVDQVKEELGKLQGNYNKLDDGNRKLQTDFKQITKKHNELKIQYEMALEAQKALELAKPTTTSQSVQTDKDVGSGLSFCASMDLSKAHQRAEKYKTAYIDIEKKLRALQTMHDKLVADNAAKPTQVNEELDVLKEKYVKLKKLAEIRGERNATLVKTIEELKQTNEMNDKLKVIVEQQKNEIQKHDESEKRKDAALKQFQLQLKTAETQYNDLFRRKESYKSMVQRLRAENHNQKDVDPSNNENVPIN